MSRPERFDLKAAQPLPCERPTPPCAKAAPPCETCAEELRCPLREVGRALARWLEA